MAMVAPEVKELRLQVDALKQRLDFMAPMLSLLNFTQDYFQRVECEASVQLMRLKNAKIGEASSSGDAPDEPGAQGAAETAKWLHIMTDIVMGLHVGPGGSSSAASTATPAVQASPALAQRSPGASARVPPRQVQASPAPAEFTASPHMAPQLAPAVVPEGVSDVFPVLASASAMTAAQLSAPAPVPTAPGGPEPPRLDIVPPRAVPVGTSPGALYPPPALATSANTGSRTSIGLASASLSVSEASRFRDPTASPSVSSASPAMVPRMSPTQAPPAGDLGQPDRLGSTLESGGLLLGRGMWANAYRQATGTRRAALTLLCATGIVTERELADDLTMISEDHIEECIQIAGEMLQRWPAQHGPPPQREAKAFFEERLAAMYMKRAPSPFGVH